MNFELIAYNYARGLWNKAMVRTAVRKGIIEKEQYVEITREAYPEQPEPEPELKPTVNERLTAIESAIERGISL